MPRGVISGISPRFRGLSQSQRQVAHVLLTRSPLEYPRKGLSARLACVKHAASVRPEPGSNSPTKIFEKICPGNKNVTKGTPTRKHLAREQKYQNHFGTGITNTLLSSQRTTAHRLKSGLDRTSVGATPPRYPVGSSLSSTKFWYLQGWAPARHTKAICR